MKIKKVIFILAVCLFGVHSEARVFDMNKEKFASYFLISGGSSTIGNSAFVNESSATAFSSAVNYNYSGEFGFLWTSQYFVWMLGFEIIRPQMLESVGATNNAGTLLYTVKSDILVTAPKFGVEINLHGTPTYRSFMTAYLGSASGSLSNEYTNVTIAPNASHTVKGSGTTSMYGGTIGTEAHISDTTTMSCELGYRVLNLTEINYSATVVGGSFNGAVSSGGAWKDTTGANRSLNLTGPYISIGFRFYLM